MTYDHSSRSVVLDSNPDFTADSGAFFVNVLRDFALKPDAPKSIAYDWQTLASWLGCADRELTARDHAKIGAAYRTYLSLGIAPSKALAGGPRTHRQSVCGLAPYRHTGEISSAEDGMKRCRLLPSRFTHQICGCPVTRVLQKTSWLPSGENAGSDETPSPATT